MMMAEKTTDGKLEKLLRAATDLFDFVPRRCLPQRQLRRWSTVTAVLPNRLKPPISCEFWSSMTTRLQRDV